MQALPGQSTELRLLHMPTAYALQQLRPQSAVTCGWCDLQEVSDFSYGEGSWILHLQDLQDEAAT
eukprot:1063324-Amphidinium_carterae.1